MSKFPSRADIVTAMRNTNVTFKVDEILGGHALQNGSRLIQYSGGYTSVFPFFNRNNEKFALRLWVADIDNAKSRTIAISKFLENLNSPYFLGFKYIDGAIVINGSYQPIVLMDWVEGVSLKEYINENIGNPASLRQVANRFLEMVSFLHKKEIAHGDLQHGNILVREDGSLVLIDYDSMFIQPLRGMKDAIKGLPGYQHPKRMMNKSIEPYLDYFSELIIYLSLLFFSQYPQTWHNYYGTEDLLFSREDFANPNSSSLIRDCLNSNNSEVSELARELLIALELDDIKKLKPLEDLVRDKLEESKKDIFKKWNIQPNPRKPSSVLYPDQEDIKRKF